MSRFAAARSKHNSLRGRESRFEQALRVIAYDQHEAACRYQFCPRNECPTCPSHAKIAKDALK